MTRVLSEEPDPWDVPPTFPERKWDKWMRPIRLDKFYERGDTRDYVKVVQSNEVKLREKLVRTQFVSILHDRLQDCALKYTTSAARRCRYIARQYLSHIHTKDYYPGHPKYIDEQLYDDIFRDNGRRPDLYGRNELPEQYRASPEHPATVEEELY